MLAAALAFLYAALATFSLLPTPRPIHHIIDDLNNREKLISTVTFGLLGVFLIAWMVCFHGELSWNGVMMDYGSKILPEKAGFILFILKHYASLTIIFAKFAIQSYAFSHSNSLIFWWMDAPLLAPLPILNIVEYLWNLQFLKDTRNFE